LLENEYESLVREEEERKNEARINNLKKKISHKRKYLAELRCDNLDLSPELASCTLQDLRKNKNLKLKAKKELKKTGLLESSSDSESESSDSEQSYKLKKEKSGKKSKSYHDDGSSDSEQSYKLKKEKSGKKSKSYHDDGSSDSDTSDYSIKKSSYSKKSGISSKSSDHVKFQQKYPHAFLRYEHVNSSVQFESLEMNLFVARELEIISQSTTKKKEREARLEFLKRFMYLNNSYEFSILKSLYAAILREIELEHKSGG
jgi:hypothetical protein